LIWTILVSINGIYAFKAIAEEKIPAVAFPEAPSGPGSVTVCVGCSCGIGAACVGAGAGTSGLFGGGKGAFSGTDEENVVPDENWMSP
jgi:hypothetical protein